MAPSKKMAVSVGVGMPFARQPATSHYIIQATLTCRGREGDLLKACFPVRASAEGWTGVNIVPKLEALAVER